jgi:hypothetical protein
MNLPSSDIVSNEESEENTTTRGTGVGNDRFVNREIAIAEQTNHLGDIDAVRRLCLLWTYSQDSNIDVEQTQPRRLGVIRNKEKEPKNVIVRLNMLNDERVKVQTGFPCLLSMLSYISIVCDGNIKEMTTSTSTLTWFEEWYMYLEIVYGKSASRWVDVSLKYNASNRTLRDIFKKSYKK